MTEIDEESRKRREDELVDLFSRAPIKKAFGMDLRYEDGCAVFEMPYNPGLDHAMEGIHGGVIATLLDNAGWFTVALYYDTWVATVELDVKLLKAASRVGLVSRGRALTTAKSLAMAEMEVRTEDGELVARGSGTFAVSGKKV